ncbi:MAG: hypothetical protein IPO86_06770 [Saprospiraceae bacterium]|nr:hypothetical protein [Saprospiraceae bacterium]MBK9727807.1 hypothetical protein [Saprospiraceae bacterium]
MNSSNKYTNLGFVFGISGIIVTFAIVIYTVVKSKEPGSFSPTLPNLFGLLPFTSTIPFIIGLFYSFKGRKEPSTVRKYMGFIINCGGAFVLIVILIRILIGLNFF